MQQYRLYELNSFIRRVLALNLAEALWIRCEIAQCNTSRGHVYLELVEKGEDGEDLIAQASGVIWQQQYRQLRKQLGIQLDGLLQLGTEVLLKARVDFHERYGLKLIVEDIDPSYTLGKLELRRQELRRLIEAEQLPGKNQQLTLAPALQRIAIISSETAAGYRDFMEEIGGNPFGYGFGLTLFPAAMQGQQVEAEVLQQLTAIAQQSARFDAVAIIRGGGAKLDLAGFDSLELCRAIAHFPLPVFTGIGHDIDETLVDLVAYRALKTPTAVAGFFIQYNSDFEARLQNVGLAIHQTALNLINQHRLRLQGLQQLLWLQPQRLLSRRQDQLQQLTTQIPLLAQLRLRQENRQLTQWEALLTLLSPENTLRRGFTITRTAAGHAVAREALSPGMSIITEFRDGTVHSRVISPTDKPTEDES